MDTLIAMQDIRSGLASIADRAEKGESFIVVRNSRPAFRIAPLTGTAAMGKKQPDSQPDASPPKRLTVNEVRERFTAYPATRDELITEKLDAILREVRARPTPPSRS